MASKLVVQTVKRVYFRGGNAKLKLTEEQLTDVGGSKFVKLSRAYGFMRLATEGCSHLNAPIGNDFSVSQSTGLIHVIRIRNEAQRAELGNQLFESTAVPKRRRVSRNALAVC